MNNPKLKASPNEPVIRYHFIFCPRYRRKIFTIDGLEDRFRRLTQEACNSNELTILEMECDVDHVYLHLECGPTWSPCDIMNVVKGASSRVLREEFPTLSSMPSLWTRDFFVTTAEILNADAIQNYVMSLKTRP